MRYWLTTHYPHYPQAEYPSQLDLWCVFVPRPFGEKLLPINKGDRVAIYVVQNGPTIVGKSPRPRGEGAVVCLAEIAGNRETCSLQEKYTDGRIGDFAWRVPCRNARFGNLDRKELCRIIGWKDKFTLRGIGRGSGLREVEASQFEQIEQWFKKR